MDIIAQEYLKQASKNVQHLVHVRILADGNCLFHSIVSLIPDSNISHVELRVRTIIELVKNKTHYIDQYTNHIGPFDAAIRRICNKNRFSELYELVALANVLNCDVQSVYPYIDYRAEMKIMNAVYKPVDISTPSNGRVIIFWSSTEDEILTRARPGNCGTWNPNHFVPLVHQRRSVRTSNNEQVSVIPDSPQKSTVKNNRVSFIRSPEFSPPKNARKHKSSIEITCATSHVPNSHSNNGPNDEQPDVHIDVDYMQKRSTGEGESENQRNARLAYQRKRSASNRSNQNDEQRNACLINEMNIAKLPEDDVPESIWATIEKIENTIDANAERAGFTNDPLADAIIQGEPNATNVYPMNASAVLDVNGTTVTSKDIGVHLLHKVKNTSINSLNDTQDTSLNNVDNEDVYIIPRSHIPVKDCYNSELFTGLFPTLFPYGYGAPYDPLRPTAVSLNQHIRYLLAYEDQRFEKHHSFMFVMFNILQRRQACWNASLMASRPYFQHAATDLQTLTTKEIEAALLSATKNTFSSIANPRINMLMKQIRAVGGNVMGSAYSRSALRTQIHALIFNQGLPSIFMTINPAGIHSRIALYFAGVDLDLDKIIPEKIPSTYERAQIIAAHPVATARFFNVLISSILKCLVEKGVLGPIKAYSGTVENQGRGSLHLHQ
ncbi:unnamed protein product [Adineta steineri]|uniref:OTU domain-containing protein n=1 Tax=Adineta steineri TaxID=433720 RepID=A0A815HBW2_9BILA|nr:unnamed protein product [Adineta steineri]CAF4094490.1 unnamed protein product [Adineta steineri]